VGKSSRREKKANVFGMKEAAIGNNAEEKRRTGRGNAGAVFNKFEAKIR